MGYGLTMAEYHTVEQGEFLAAIAAAHGFMSSATIWNHPANCDLKALRVNPNILLPGDQIFIPDKEKKEVRIEAGKSSRFQITREKLKVRLVLEELYSGPLGQAKVEVLVDGASQALTADDDGTVEFDVPPAVKSLVLTIKEEGAQQEGVAIPLRVGHLDPVEEQSGQIARLNNLGYFAGASDDVDEELFRSAVEEFQCDHKLKVDGVCGPRTQKKLQEIHGC